MDHSGVYKRDEGDRPVEHSPRGRYIRFDIKLGTGAYKTVYKAYDTDQGIDVAWNAIDIGVLPSAEKTRIIQEVQLLQRLEHKNIINFYGSWFSKEKNQVVFITEIMTSGTLKSYIKRVQFVKWKIIKRWCIQILEGLHYLHSQQPPVIHRDLKCDNIFINGNTGDLRIGDLGLSTQLAVQKTARAQSVLGTPEFMAPELYDESYDEKVDIYAFGMCVLEMVTKDVPYSECINPAQIYKKVTAGIRPRGLQRIVSDAAKDFIELCLSRGNGLIDVSASYLLDHPFLKAQDDDGEMVRCLEEDELERELKLEQTRLTHVSEESFAEELNMESCSKESDQTSRTRRTTFSSLDPEELASSSSSTAATTSTGGSRSVALGSTTETRLGDVQHAAADDKTQHVAAAPLPPLPPPPLAAAVAVATNAANAQAHEPVMMPSLHVDEPLSGKKDVDHNVNQFLATMPGSESKMQDNRMNVMGGRGHRLELLEQRSSDDATLANSNSDVDDRSSDDRSVEPPKSEPTALAGDASSSAAAALVPPAPSSAPLTESRALQPAIPPPPSFPSRSPSESVLDFSHLRRSSLLAPSSSGSDYVQQQQQQPIDPDNRPPSASSSSSSTATNPAPAAASVARKRGRRHEIRAEKDPENEHSIVLYLRLTIDGKSKVITFPFNLFSDSTHDVACELALDVAILEPDLEDIAESIAFLVTEGKINNLPHVTEDVWEEAPEPHSFSSKPLPHVSKMSFVAKPGPGVPTTQLQHVPNHLLASPGPGAVEWPPPPAAAYSLGESAVHAAAASNESSVPAAVATSQPSGTIVTSQTPAPAAAIVVQQPQPPQQLPQLQLPPPSTDTNTASMLPPPVASVAAPTPAAAAAPPPSLTVLTNENVPPVAATSGSRDTTTPTSASPINIPRSPHFAAAAAQLLHSTSDLSLLLDGDRAPNMHPEIWERGISVGSINDPSFMRKVHGIEDRLKNNSAARSAFDERDSNLVAAMREAEVKHLLEVERFRRQMEELSKQRAAIAYPEHRTPATGTSATSQQQQQPEDDVDLCRIDFDESLQLGQNGIATMPIAVANGVLPPMTPVTGVDSVGGALDQQLRMHADASAAAAAAAAPTDPGGFPVEPMLARSVSFDARRLESPSPSLAPPLLTTSTSNNSYLSSSLPSSATSAMPSSSSVLSHAAPAATTAAHAPVVLVDTAATATDARTA